MSMQSRFFFALAFVIVILSAALDREANAGGGQQNCDTLCHNRIYSYPCSGGSCVEYQVANCLVCWGWNNAEGCTVGDGSTADCVPVIKDGKQLPNNSWRLFSCDALCDCDNYALSEASNPGAVTGASAGGLYTCGGTEP